MNVRCEGGMTSVEALLAIIAGIGLGILFSEDKYHLRAVFTLGGVALVVWLTGVIIK